MTDFILDACTANGAPLVAREIANYLRRILRRPRPHGATGIEIQRVYVLVDDVQPMEADELPPRGARVCFSVYYRTDHLGAVWFADLPTIGAALFFAESVGGIWSLPVHNKSGH